MDLMTSPTPVSAAANVESRTEKEERAGLVPSHGISVQNSSHATAHRPATIKHVYGFCDASEELNWPNNQYTDRHLHTTVLYAIITAAILLRVK